MTQEYDIKALASKVKALRRNVEAIMEMGAGIPAIEKNAERILADVKMLELNVNDAVEYFKS